MFGGKVVPGINWDDDKERRDSFALVIDELKNRQSGGREILAEYEENMR